VELIGRRYDTSELVRLDVAHGVIQRVTPCMLRGDGTAAPPWIAPGLIDIQVNGYGGQEFSALSSTPEKVVAIADKMAAFGVTRFCPTLTTEQFPVLEHALRAIAAACESSSAVARRIAGVHLEGPYISAEDGPRGAHPRQCCRPPDGDEFERLQDAAGGRIRILTMSAEFDGAARFIERVTRSDVVVAIGHTAASTEQIRAAVDAGARLSTHLGNGCHHLLHRHRNYLWEQLAEDRLLASLIVDGHHLPPAVVQTFVRAKTPERCILVSDLSGYAGLPPGRYAARTLDVEILDNGRLVIAGQTELLAGATSPIGDGVANVMRFAGVSLAEAVAMATEHPARLLGIEQGRLAPGQPADLVMFDLADAAEAPRSSQFHVRAVLIGGEVVVGSLL
jgi:N-acetylglucosamine-6-phosphate deacetylase